MIRNGRDMSEGQTCCQQKLLHKRRRIDKNFCKNMIIQASTPSTMHEKSFTLCRRSSSFWFWLRCPEVFSCKRGVLGSEPPNLCASVQCLLNPLFVSLKPRQREQAGLLVTWKEEEDTSLENHPIFFATDEQRECIPNLTHQPSFQVENLTKYRIPVSARCVNYVLMKNVPE